jgi:hypothetical protein
MSTNRNEIDSYTNDINVIAQSLVSRFFGAGFEVDTCVNSMIAGEIVNSLTGRHGTDLGMVAIDLPNATIRAHRILDESDIELDNTVECASKIREMIRNI